MLFIVDGYNAVRRVDRLRQAEARDGLAPGRAALVSAIVSSGILKAHRVVVIFDGGDDVYGAEPTPHRSLEVRFSRPPENADEAIVRSLESRGKVEPTTVVTADAELAFASRRAGAAVVAPESWEGLRVPKRRRRAVVGQPSDKPTATKDDVAYWLDIFKEDS